MKKLMALIVVMSVIGVPVRFAWASKDAAGKLSEEAIKILCSEEEEGKEEAEKQLLETTLSWVGLSSWLEEGPTYVLESGNVSPSQGEELVVAISMGKDNGMLAVYEKSVDGYEIKQVVDGLVPITDLELLQLPNKMEKAILIEEFLDEFTGGYFQVKANSIYVLGDGGIQRVWMRPIYIMELYTGTNSDDIHWLMKIESVDMLYEPKGTIHIEGENTIWRSISPGDFNNSQFEQIERRLISEHYVWNEGNKAFKELFEEKMSRGEHNVG